MTFVCNGVGSKPWEHTGTHRGFVSLSNCTLCSLHARDLDAKDASSELCKRTFGDNRTNMDTFVRVQEEAGSDPTLQYSPGTQGCTP
eukprot:1157540-Pelagomonas_calceolata.AAC.4